MTAFQILTAGCILFAMRPGRSSPQQSTVPRFRLFVSGRRAGGRLQDSSVDAVLLLMENGPMAAGKKRIRKRLGLIDTRKLTDRPFRRCFRSSENQ